MALHSFEHEGTRGVYVVPHDGDRGCRGTVAGPAMATLGPAGDASWVSWTLADGGVTRR